MVTVVGGAILGFDVAADVDGSRLAELTRLRRTLRRPP
jgi:hypothetical protein